MVRRLILIMLIGFLCVNLSEALAQDKKSSRTIDTAPTAKELEVLVSTLEDPIAMERMKSQLRALIAAHKKEQEAEHVSMSERAVDFLSQKLTLLSTQVVSIGSAFLDTPQAMRWFNKQASDAAIRDRWIRLSTELALVLMVGFTLKSMTSYILRHPRDALGQRTVFSRTSLFMLLILRTLLDTIPILVFALGGLGVMAVTDPPREIRLVAMAIINSTMIVNVVVVLTRFLLSPSTQNLRLFSLTDETANYILIWIRRMAYTLIYGYFISHAGLILGLPQDLYMVLLKIVGGAVAIMLVVLIFQNRHDVARHLHGKELVGKESDSTAIFSEKTLLFSGAKRLSLSGAAFVSVRHKLSLIWHIVATIYVLVIYGVWAMEVEGGFLYMMKATAITLALLLGARLLVYSLRLGIRKGFSVSPELRAQYPNLEARANLYLPIFEKMVRGAIWIFALLAMASAWGVDSLSWMQTSTGQRVLSGAASIFVVLMMAIVMWEIVSQSIERYLTGSLSDGHRVERSARTRTLLPLLRNAILVILLTVVTLVTLSELGLNIAPLLAGAGVIGLAVGFGSQTLVKDVISGLFYLFEDTISVGDIVRVSGDHAGVVEAISIRTLKLRDFSGAVHTIPFSAVTTVTNMTKDFSYAVFEISVSYKEDLDRVIQVMETTGDELQKDPMFSMDILESMDIQGLDRFSESAVVIKARIKTRPTRQFAVMRAYNLLLKKNFDAASIEIPYPHQTLILERRKPKRTLEEVSGAKTPVVDDDESDEGSNVIDVGQE